MKTVLEQWACWKFRDSRRVNAATQGGKIGLKIKRLINELGGNCLKLMIWMTVYSMKQCSPEYQFSSSQRGVLIYQATVFANVKTAIFFVPCMSWCFWSEVIHSFWSFLVGKWHSRRKKLWKSMLWGNCPQSLGVLCAFVWVCLVSTDRWGPNSLSFWIDTKVEILQWLFSYLRLVEGGKSLFQ